MSAHERYLVCLAVARRAVTAWMAQRENCTFGVPLNVFISLSRFIA